jgi:hypothetical protein
LVRGGACSGVACAATPATDPGQDWISFAGHVTGSFSITRELTWPAAGSELFCLWLTPAAGGVSDPIAQTVTFRAPTGAIAATVNPVAGRSGGDAQVLVTGTSEASRAVFAAVQSLAVACAPTYTGDPGAPLSLLGVGGVGSRRVLGPFTLSGTVHLRSPGHYQVCLWLASTSTDAIQVIGASSAPFDVLPPAAHVSAAGVRNCRSGQRARPVHSRVTPAVCLRYHFGTRPQPGQPVDTHLRHAGAPHLQAHIHDVDRGRPRGDHHGVAAPARLPPPPRHLAGGPAGRGSARRHDQLPRRLTREGLGAAEVRPRSPRCRCMLGA